MFTCVHSTTHSPISRKKKEKEKQKLEPENQSQTFIYISYMYHYIYRLDPNIKFSIARLKKKEKKKKNCETWIRIRKSNETRLRGDLDHRGRGSTREAASDIRSDRYPATGNEGEEGRRSPLWRSGAARITHNTCSRRKKSYVSLETLDGSIDRSIDRV